MSLTIISLIKQVPLPTEMKMGEDGLMERNKAKSIINIDCQYALEAGLQLRKQYPDARLLVCSMGPPSFEQSLRKALAMGYEEAYLLSDKKLGGSDTFATGLALASLLRHLGFTPQNNQGFIVLAGRQTSDGDTAHVPSQVAANLDIPQATFVEHITFDDKACVLAKRIIEGGFQQMKLPLPCVISLTPTGISPRKPTLFGMIKARNKKINILGVDDIALNSSQIGINGSPTIVVKVVDVISDRPPVVMIEGDNEKEKIQHLIRVLEDNVQPASKKTLHTTKKMDYPDFPFKDIRGEHRGILTWAEVSGTNISRSSLELLGVARQLANQLNENTKITTVLIGDEVNPMADILMAYGADEVILVEDKHLKEYLILPFASVFSKIIKERKPEIVLFSATTSGRELAPRVAVSSGSGITADCTQLEIGAYVNRKEETIIEPLLHSYRPTYGESKIATILGFKFPQISTARPGTFKMPAYDDTRKGKISSFIPQWKQSDFCVELLQTFRGDAGMQSLFEAEIIVAGGRGALSDNLQLIKDLAQAFQARGIAADWAASRAVVDDGYAAYARQIGQTGKTVRPKLYIAVGISGAIQHIAGIKEAGKIVAIDRNAKAPIFKYADYGIVGDYRDLLPEWIAQVKQD
ncbi:MAG: FAD-binding protein [Bacteroidales bacterium]|jgi:electron transfer flavoprotein alpha subunit|nr:FAD-binding protein [Bacteroidales bacterium]MDD3331412.1 FAD-binding protein [Bacteroidales bacterium]MDD3691252.1 FAD-binding protein [Bacteroidales bacterium]MDD4044423.1 FAD-binding protein [Bacteroidales bacterium]MDX9889413.1 FAD-binding protein [Bacteroidales bacterium]